jgi:hypothetical protein
MSIKLVIGNTAEAFAPLLRRVQESSSGKKIIQHEHTLSQRAFFYGGSHTILVTPEAMPHALMQHNMKVFGYSDVRNIYPSTPKIALTAWVAKSPRALRDVLIKKDVTMLHAYATTNSLMQVQEKLRAHGVSSSVEADATNETLWLQEYLGSKIGFRAEMTSQSARCGGVRIPSGFPATSLKEVEDMLIWFYHEDMSALVKINKGESGWGIWVMCEHKYKTHAHMLRAFRKESQANSVWANTEYVVENCIDIDRSTAGGSPSVEMFVDRTGPQVTYICGQVLDGRQFTGVELGKGVLSTETYDTLRAMSETIGKQYYTLGYRGYFDIDFVMEDRITAYAVETNMRRTGGTHVYEIARHLLGKQWEEGYYLFSQDDMTLGRFASSEAVLDRVRSILYPMRGKQKGLIVTSMNKVYPVIGVVIIAEDRDEGERLRSHLIQLLA